MLPSSDSCINNNYIIMYMLYRNLIEHRGNNKPLLLSTLPVIRNNNETNSSSIWNLAHYAISPTDHHDHFSGSSAILVITIFVGFTLTGLFLLWRRHRYANRSSLHLDIIGLLVLIFIPRIIREVICHYTTLNQEVTLSANDIPDANGDQEFHLDLSDDTADTSTSDDEVSTYCFSCFSI